MKLHTAVATTAEVIEKSTARATYENVLNVQKRNCENEKGEYNENEYDDIQQQFNSRGRNCRIKYVCFSCNKKFNTEDLYLKHLKAHSENNGFQCKCDICQQVFKNEDKMRHHRQFHFI